MTKKDRLSAIISLIEENEIGTQEELTQALNDMGYNVSQATVSRDINALALVKAEGVTKKSKYIKPISRVVDIPKNFIDIFKHVTESIVGAGNLVVVKTVSGNANSVGIVVDKLHMAEILGTIAGDDTLLIVTKSENDANKVIRVLKKI